MEGFEMDKRYSSGKILPHTTLDERIQLILRGFYLREVAADIVEVNHGPLRRQARLFCGLLPATGGTLRVAGVDLRHARASARQRIGYVAQKFSLYEQLSVTENLEFFASAYGLRGSRKRERIDWAMKQFELTAHARLPSGQLPGGYKQRLAMAAALIHEPEILFLDEPTSGADPLARREFWRRITALAQQQVTVIVTTHFMQEAEYCDRIAVMDAGRLLAQGTPAEVRRRAR